ncbi:hypothetical protein [Nitrospira moscoviensis]|uniref:Uncharacterized protein n=1 Tax=Nitrospira moscoviensis TaxID=42253 RepID=A0A0K2GF20_NITMO|nr:hypothetical protein [Nitrospira moscoviensis]ALA59207.1 hypothetical protein NITMOv2_2798 [Nitrospira moscoviensis]
MMDTQDSSGATRDRPWDPVTAPVAAPAASGSSDAGSLRPSADGRGEWSLGRFVHDIEALIQRYPWPTIFLGMGAGFLLARRMR